jgi:hypothetical protein
MNLSNSIRKNILPEISGIDWQLEKYLSRQVPTNTLYFQLRNKLFNELYNLLQIQLYHQVYMEIKYNT